MQEVPSPKEDYTYTAPSIASLEYNGNPQSVLSSGASVNPTSPAVDDATFMYAMTSSATTEPEDGDWKTDYRDLKITDRTELSNKHIWYKIVVDDNHSLPEGARESGAIYLGNPRMTPKPINISWGYNVVIMHNYEDVNDDLRDSLIYAPKASCYGLVPGDEAYPVVKTYDGNPNPKKDPETQITPKAGEEIFLDGNLEISDLREDRTYWAKVVSFTGKDADNYLVDTTTVEALEWQLLPIQEFAEQVLITDIDELIEQVEANTTAINQLNNDIDNICSDIDKISSDIEGLISDISDLEDA